MSEHGSVESFRHSVQVNSNLTVKVDTGQIIMRAWQVEPVPDEDHRAVRRSDRRRLDGRRDMQGVRNRAALEEDAGAARRELRFGQFYRLKVPLGATWLEAHACKLVSHIVCGLYIVVGSHSTTTNAVCS